MTSVIYSKTKLPGFVSGTSGHAIPLPESRIACRIPQGFGHVLAPWESQSVGTNHWHMVLQYDMSTEGKIPSLIPEWWPEGMPRPDEYGNDEVLDTCTPIRKLCYGEDTPADLLYLTYRAAPDGVVVFEVEKTVPVVVLGQVDEDILFATSESVEGGAAKVSAGSYILASPLRERYYFNTPEKFHKLYGGQIFPGPVPKRVISQVVEDWKSFGIEI